MPIDCTGSLTADIIFDCANAPVAGIEQNVVLINKDDIDVAATTISATNRIMVTNLQLKPGKTGYLLTGVKQSNGKAWELVKKENAPDKFKHTFSGVIFNPGADNKQQADQLSKGGKYVAVIEQVWKGEDSAEAFEILGLSSGLELSTMTNSSKENDVIIGRAMGLPSSTSNMIWLGDGYGNPLIVKNSGAVDITGTSLTFNGTPLAGGAFVPTAGGTMTGTLTVNKSASSGAALIVNQPDTSSGVITQWQIGGANRATIDSGGRFRSDVGVCNLSSVVNALVSTLITGTEISRDVADSNTIGKFKNKNASSTGDFFRNENSAGTVLGGAKYTGQFYQTVAPASGSNELVRAVDVQFTTPSYTAVTTTYTTGTTRTITANGTFTITLATTGIPDGMEYCIKNIGSGTITISGTIDGVSGAILTAGQVVIVRKTGSAYIKIN